MTVVTIRHATTRLRRLAALALLIAAPAALAQPPAPLAPPVTAFDGSYTGVPVADAKNRTPPCAKPQIAIMDVQNGAARMRSSFDRRKGQVQPDGRLAMRGVLVVGWQQIPGFVEGRLTETGFEGVSRFPSVSCTYRWTLQKSR